MNAKHLPIPATAWMLLLVLLALLLRLILIHLNWPVPNADEATIDLMALHIAKQGEHPIFFYGQEYMGTIQAYLGAAFGSLFGISTSSIRLGTLLLFTLYLISMYYLVRMLYTHAFALVVIALLALGSDRMITIPLQANGGYAETLFFGALIFLLASWLALTFLRSGEPSQGAQSHEDGQFSEPGSGQQGGRGERARRERLMRVGVYGLLGCTVGLALWSDLLILPAIFTAGLLLLLCCRRELWGWAGGVLLAGLQAGALPLLIYNIYAAPGHDSLHVLVGTIFAGTPRIIPFWQQLLQALLISLPLATGMPFTNAPHTICGTGDPYPISNLSSLFPGSNPWLCFSSRGAWSLGIIALWWIAVSAIVRFIKTQKQQAGSIRKQHAEDWQPQICQYARLMLLSSGALWFLLFALSSAAADSPRASSRYLICVLLALPALLWPLWQGMNQVPLSRIKRKMTAWSRPLISFLLLASLSAVYVRGTTQIFEDMPYTQSVYQQRELLIQGLLHYGATRIYSDYGTCNVLIFQSNEHIICSVLDDHLRTGVNRYPPYRDLVAATLHPAYVFIAGSAAAQAATSKLTAMGGYRHSVVAGYSVYYYA